MIISSLVTFGLTSISLLPQLSWLPYTTRQLLIHDRQTFPQWKSLGEFAQSIAWPWEIISQLDSEKWLALGILTIS